MSHRTTGACLLVVAALAAPAVARADSSPNTTTTEPVSTVTTVPAPTPPPVSIPAPDAAPVHKASHARQKRVVHSAPVVHRQVTTTPASAPVRSYSPPAQRSSRPVVTVRAAKQHVVRHVHKATHSSRHKRPPASPKHKRPVTQVPKPVPAPPAAPAPVPAAKSSGNSWIAPAAIVMLLVAIGLVAAVRAMRRADGRSSEPSAILRLPPLPPPLLPSELVAAAAPTIESEPEPEPDPVAELEPSPVAAPPANGSCRIGWWRGYLRSSFYAYEQNGDGETKLVAESPPFSWHSSEPPTESPAALAAYATLVEKLERLGWEPEGAGENWFSGRFQRTISVTHRVTV